MSSTRIIRTDRPSLSMCRLLDCRLLNYCLPIVTLPPNTYPPASSLFLTFLLHKSPISFPARFKGPVWAFKMASRRSSRGNIALQTPPDSDLPNFRRSSRGIASPAQKSPQYNPSRLRRSSRGTIAATELNPPNAPGTQHSQEFQSNPDG